MKKVKTLDPTPTRTALLYILNNQWDFSSTGWNLSMFFMFHVFSLNFRTPEYLENENIKLRIYHTKLNSYKLQVIQLNKWHRDQRITLWHYQERRNGIVKKNNKFRRTRNFSFSFWTRTFLRHFTILLYAEIYRIFVDGAVGKAER